MSAQRESDKLDELIARTINTEKPQFDAEKWRQKYCDEYRTLGSRRERAASARQPGIWRAIFGKPVVQFATAATVIVAVGLLFIRDRQDPNGPTAKPPLIVHSPAKMISMASMRVAYQRGGLDALDEQFRDALDVFGPRSSSVSIRELLEDSTMF